MDFLLNNEDMELKTVSESDANPRPNLLIPSESTPSCSMQPRPTFQLSTSQDKGFPSFKNGPTDLICTPNYFPGIRNRLPLPGFWPSNVKLWFVSVEAIFDTYFVISERERYNHLLASLKQDEISRVGLVILSDVGCTPYTKLKVALIQHYEMNEVTRLNKLLNETTLSGKERPSDLLHRMKKLGRL